MSVSSSVRRVTGAAAVAAVMVGATALPAAATGQQPGRLHHGVVYISGVQHDGLSRADHSNRALNKQWVDVTNSSRRVVNLERWTLSDADGHTYTFHHVRLAGRATVRVHTGVGRDTRTDIYQDRRTRAFDRNADRVILRDDRARLVDAVSWGHGNRRDVAVRHHGMLHGTVHGMSHHREVGHLRGEQDRGHRH